MSSLELILASLKLPTLFATKLLPPNVEVVKVIYFNGVKIMLVGCRFQDIFYFIFCHHRDEIN